MHDGRDRRRLVAVLATALLVATPGCSALDDTRSTRTPFDVNDSEYSAREAVRNGSVVAFDTENDHAPQSAVLAQAHTNALVNTSYTLNATRRTYNTNGTVRFTVDEHAAVGDEQTRFVYSVDANYPDRAEGTLDRYGNGTHVFVRGTSQDSERYEIEPITHDTRDPNVESVVTDAIRSGLYATNVTNVERATDT